MTILPCAPRAAPPCNESTVNLPSTPSFYPLPPPCNENIYPLYPTRPPYAMCCIAPHTSSAPMRPSPPPPDCPSSSHRSNRRTRSQGLLPDIACHVIGTHFVLKLKYDDRPHAREVGHVGEAAGIASPAGVMEGHDLPPDVLTGVFQGCGRGA